jgi:hypothetical protein
MPGAPDDRGVRNRRSPALARPDRRTDARRDYNVNLGLVSNLNNDTGRPFCHGPHSQIHRRLSMRLRRAGPRSGFLHVDENTDCPGPHRSSNAGLSAWWAQMLHVMVTTGQKHPTIVDPTRQVGHLLGRATKMISPRQWTHSSFQATRPRADTRLGLPNGAWRLVRARETQNLLSSNNCVRHCSNFRPTSVSRAAST